MTQYEFGLAAVLLVSTTFWLCTALEMMQNGTRTSKFGMRSEQLCFWCMLLIFVEYVNKDDVFGKSHLPTKMSGLQMILQWFLHGDVQQRGLQRGLPTLFCMFVFNNWMYLKPNCF